MLVELESYSLPHISCEYHGFYCADALWHGAPPKGLQGKEVQAGEALAQQGGLCPHHEKPTGLLPVNCHYDHENIALRLQ